MRRILFCLVFGFMAGCMTVSAEPQRVLSVDHPEASPFDEASDAKSDVEAALAKGKAENKITLVTMGANWCHDSRALAGWFITDDEFSNLISNKFSLVYVDVGQKDRNIDIAQSFGYDEIVGTPTLFMVAPDGTVLNSETAGTWRNSASRTRSEILAALKDVNL